MATGNGARVVAGMDGARTRVWTEARRLAFFAALVERVDLAEAAGAAGTSIAAVLDRRRHDAGFARDWEIAIELIFCELELLLLRQAVKGVERTETVINGEDGAIRQIKTVHSFPHGLAVRLLDAQRAALAANGRQSDSESEAARERAAVAERVRNELERVRARLRHGSGRPSSGDRGGRPETDGHGGGPGR